MSDKEVLQMYNEMLEHFGELPNFEHHPLQFANCVRMYKYWKETHDRIKPE